MNWRGISGAGLLALVVVVTVAASTLVPTLMPAWRVDLTENGVYSLSEPLRNLLANVDEDIDITLYFSRELAEGYPQLGTYARLVEETLAEMSIAANGRLKVRSIDPEPFSEDEDAAAAAGLKPLPANLSGDQIYFGLVARNGRGDTEVIPFFDPRREAFLKYDLAKRIHALDRERTPVVGLVSSLPVDGGFDFTSGGRSEPWFAIEQLDAQFDVRRVSLGDADALQELDVLVLIHPKDLDAASQYAIDQFVLRGGRLLAFFDPLAESDTAPNPMMAMPVEDQSSSLGALLAAWGVTTGEGQVVGDDRNALPVSMGRNAQPIRHLTVIGLGREFMASNDVVTADLRDVNLSSAGYLAPVEGADTRFEPLLWSSTESGLIDAAELKFLTDPRALRRDFKIDDVSYTLAARVTGTVRSAFADGPPPDESGDHDSEATDADQATDDAGQPADAGAEATPTAAHLDSGEIAVILVADTDLLTDPMWVQRLPDFFGRQLAAPFAGNGNFVLNAVDQLLGDTGLISVRGQAGFSRPFTRVEALRRRAEERFLQKEQQLEARLKEAEARLLELEQQRDDDAVTLTPEQEAEIRDFTLEKIEIRRQLREVQRQLTSDIERLGTTLKLVNTLLVPALLVVLALGLLVWRRVRERPTG